MYWCDRQRRRRRVAVYVRTNLHSSVWVKPVNDDWNYELLCVRVGDVIVGALYHPPRASYTTHSPLNYIESCTDKLSQDFPAASIVLAGDLNQIVDRDAFKSTLCESFSASESTELWRYINLCIIIIIIIIIRGKDRAAVTCPPATRGPNLLDQIFISTRAICTISFVLSLLSSRVTIKQLLHMPVSRCSPINPGL